MHGMPEISVMPLMTECQECMDWTGMLAMP